MSKYNMVDGKPVMIVEKKSVEDLRKIVSGIVAGTFFVSPQAPSDLLQSIFMPLVFGALAVPEEVCTELLGPRPPEEDMYTPGDPPKCAEFPPEPRPVQDMAPILDIDPEKARDFNFGDITEEEFSQHILSVEAENLKNKEKFDKANSDLKVEKKAWKKKVSRIKAAHLKALEKFLASEATRMENFLKNSAKADEWYARKEELFSNWLSDIGVIGEEIHKAEPCSINGYPIFFSFTTIHKDDWGRIRVAVNREIKARDEMDV